MRLSVAVLALVAALPVCAAAGEIDPCDVTAGHPSDPDRIGPGVATADVVTHVAIPACRAAIDREPDNARFHYQLGRAIVYWAQANGADPAEGAREVAVAADMGYRQAQFVSGYLHKLGGDLCAAEPLYRAAAEQGLKSARLSYVDEMLAGNFDDCGPGASTDDMRAFLDGAAEQVSGYYENMLLGSLRRQLAERSD